MGYRTRIRAQIAMIMPPERPHATKLTRARIPFEARMPAFGSCGCWIAGVAGVIIGEELAMVHERESTQKFVSLISIGAHQSRRVLALISRAEG